MSVDATTFLNAPEKFPAAPFCVVYGDDVFLKREAIVLLRKQVLSDEDAEFSLSVFAGKTADVREVFDELCTAALFGGERRVVVLEDADDFVTKQRPRLEDYAARPSQTGVLVLEVRTWRGNTKLAKAVESSGLAIDCTAPKPRALSGWVEKWAQSRHGVAIERQAAALLVDIVGPELGLVDQELAKLAAATGEKTITAPMVEELVGGWRAKTVWDMLDAAAEGNAAKALEELDRLLQTGEQPIAVLGQMSFSLRKFAAATRLVQKVEREGRRPSLRSALTDVGIRSFVLEKSEHQLRQLGRERAGKLYEWLLETDVDLKGGSSLPPRTVLERLILRMSATAK